MLLEGSSDIVANVERREIKSQMMELVFLNDQKVLAIAKDSLALYKDVDAISDPLGNGLICMANLEEIEFNMDEPVVLTHRSGFIGLVQDKVLLILPNAIKLFHNKEDALQGQKVVCSLELGS